MNSCADSFADQGFAIDGQSKIGFRVRLEDLSAGAICSVLSVAYSLSYATLIFSGPLSQWLGYGMVVTLLSASVGTFVIGLRSSLPFAIAGPDSSTSVVVAALVTAFVQRMVAEGATEDLLQRAIIVMALSTALTGMVLLGLGLRAPGVRSASCHIRLLQGSSQLLDGSSS